jgi:hypothetical protein
MTIDLPDIHEELFIRSYILWFFWLCIYMFLILQ